MEIKNNVLTEKERAVLILCAENPNCRYLGNDKITRRLGISVNNLKAAIHRICIRLDSHNRNETIITALQKRQVGLRDLCCILDEVTKRFKSLCPDMLRRIANLCARKWSMIIS